MLRVDADVGARLMLVVLCVIWGVDLADHADRALRNSAAEHANGDCGARRADALSGVPPPRPQLARCRTRGDGRISPIASLLNIVAFTVFGSFAQLSAATSRVTILAYTMPIWAGLVGMAVSRANVPNRMQATALASVRRRSRHPDLSVGRNEDCAGNLAGAPDRRVLGGRHGLSEVGADQGRSRWLSPAGR